MGSKNQPGSHLLIVALAVVVLAAAGLTGYVVYQNNNTYKAPLSSSQTAAKSNAAAGTNKPIANNAHTASTVPSATQASNIKAAITSGNTAALQSYMASSVSVVIAASEGMGPQTPAQAVKDVDYVSAGTNWDFALPAATLSKYQSGAYKQYFPANALVGQSSNKYLISFQFDSSGKIDAIFMAKNADGL